jgi:HEAT repeat protein
VEQCSHHRTAPIRAVVCFALALTAGCGGSGAPQLQDANKPVPELRSMLKDPNVEVQARGALGLSRAGAEARAAVPDLIPLLKSASTLVRQNAAVALGAIGPDARAAVAALSEALRDTEWAVRRAAAQALGAIGAKEALPALKRLEGDANKQVRDAAKKAREQIGG